MKLGIHVNAQYPPLANQWGEDAVQEFTME
jgi:hypothetical protein